MPVELTITETDVILESSSTPGPPGQGVAAGGTTGQILAKNSNTDYDTEWIDAGTPGLHATSHQDGGTDEISLTGLSGTSAALQAHIDDASDAHDASAVSSIPAGGLASTDVQAALNELDSEKAATSHAHAGEDITSGTVADARIDSTIARDSEVTSAISAHEADTTSVHGIADTSALALTANHPTNATFNDHSARHENGGADEISLAGLDGTPTELTNHLNDTTDAHDASAISFVPTGTIAATDVQAAIAEVASEASGVTDLEGLSDVDLTSPLAGHHLEYDQAGAIWINQREVFSGDHFRRASTVISETCSRSFPNATAVALVSQRLELYGIYLPKGAVVASITFVSSSTGLAGGTNQFFGLYDDQLGSSSGTVRALLRGTSDDGATAWAANTEKTLTLTSSYTTVRSGVHYLGILINATTVPTLTANAAGAAAAIAGLAPALGGTSNTGVTSLPNPANAISANARLVFAYVSA